MPKHNRNSEEDKESNKLARKSEKYKAKVKELCRLETDRTSLGEVLKREWKILRDSMRQALKRSKTGATTKAGLPCKKWRFQSRMAFVLPYMTIRRSRRSKDGVKMDDTDIASDQEREPEVWDPCHLSSTEHDSLDLFFASVCQSTKRLPKKFQSSVKRQVLDALLRVEDEWETEQTESKTEVNKDFH